MKATSKAIAGMATLVAVPQRLDGGAANSAQVRPPETSATQPNQGVTSTETLRIATCQFPVSGNPAENGDYIRDFMEKAAGSGAHLLHTSEACLPIASTSSTRKEGLRIATTNASAREATRSTTRQASAW